MTRQELEARRLSAIPDLLSKMSQRAIAKRYGVSRMTIHRWKTMLQNDGLQARKAPGRPPRMTPEQVRFLRVIWKKGPGRDFEHWTARRFAEAIQHHMSIKFSRDHVGRIMHRMGLR